MARLAVHGILAAILSLSWAAPSFAQGAAWSRTLGAATGPAYLGNGQIITRSMAVDAGGNPVVTGSVINASQADFMTTRLDASSGSVAWQKSFAGSGGSADESYSVAVDGAGNAVVVGMSATTASSAMQVVKYAAADGSVLWERTVDSGRDAIAYFVAVDGSGDVVVAGDAVNAAGSWDIRVMKLSGATGATRWDRTFDGGLDDFSSDLAIDSVGNVLVLGVTRNAAGNDDILVVKYAAADGTLAWRQAIDGGGADAPTALAIDAAGNALVAGYSVAATVDYRTVKLAAADGSIVWSRAFDGGGDDFAQALAVDASGNAVVTGYSRAGGRNVFVTIKYAAADGALLWQRSFDSGAGANAYQIALDSSGNAYVTGSSAAAGGTDWKTLGYASADGATFFEHSYAGSAGADDDAYALATVAGAVLVAGVVREVGVPAAVRVMKLATGGASAPAGGNVALASAGAAATASSIYGGGFAPGAVIDGDRAGRNWGSGSGWNDATPGTYPDWVQVAFGGAKAIDRVVVYTLQDDPTNPVEPTDTLTFTRYGIVDFTIQGWDGSSWVTLGVVAGNNLVKRTVSFASFTTDRIRVNVTRSLGGYSHVTEIEAFGSTPGGAGGATGGINAALASAGATATASSTYGAGFAASAAINGDRAGRGWGSGSGWNDATANAFPDWLQVSFNQGRTIDRVIVYSLQDDATAPAEPTDAMTFTRYGLQDFTVEGWNGSSWTTLGSVSGNNLVKRTVSFSPVTTDRVRVNVTRALGGYSHVTELEAWTTSAAPAQADVALASAGSTASASSSYGAAFPASAAIDGDRAGLNWGAGSGWNDGTANAFPDWLHVDFGAMRTIDRVVVYTLQDDPASPAEPTDTMTFTRYGVQDFTVEGWTGTSWVLLGRVIGNNLVKRTMTFPAVAVDRIHITVTRALGGYAHLTEVEAWGS